MDESSDELDRLADAIDLYLDRDRSGDTSGASQLFGDRPELREFLEPMLEGGDDEQTTIVDDVPSRIGPYVIHGELGRGGMGIVYSAEHEQLGRPAAVKVLPELMSLSPRRISRFLREAKVAARLDHPGLVRIHEVGEVKGTWWFAMDLVAGDTLRDRLRRAAEMGVVDLVDARLWIASCDSRYEEAAEVGIQLADAVAHAHSHGLVHRDIKPQNILIDEVGRVRLVDFGLAKDLDAQTLTRTGDFLGTPHYCAPEQVDCSDADDVDGRADLFSIGCVIYEILAMRRPFDGRSTESILRAVVADEPRSLLSIDPHTPPDLATIVARTMEKNPAHRYQSAGELLEDLRRFRRGERIVARRRSAWSRWWRWSRRHKGGALAIALGFALFVVAPITAAIVLEQKNIELLRERDAARRHFEAANRAVDQLFTRIAESPTAGDMRLQRFRRSLLLDARRFYEEFLAQARGRGIDSVRREVALATGRIAVVDYELGRYEEAAAGFADALRAMRALGEPRRDLLETAEYHGSRGLALFSIGKPDEADHHYAEAQRLWRQVTDPAMRLRATVRSVRMRVSRAQRLIFLDPDRAMLELDGAIANIDELEADGHESVMLALDRGIAETSRASLLVRGGDYRGAAAALSRADEVRRRVPDLPRTRGLTSTSTLVRAQLLQGQGRRDDAERLLRRCLTVLEQQLAPQPDNLAIRYDLVNVADQLGRLLIQMERHDDAFAVTHPAMLDAVGLGRFGTGRVLQVRLLAMIRTTTATAATFCGFDDVDQIDEWFALAIADMRELQRSLPEDAPLMNSLGGMLNNHAMRFLRREPRDRERALKLLAEAADWQRRALATRPEDARFRSYLFNHLTLIAPSLMIVGRPDEAFAALAEANELAGKRPAKLIQNAAGLAECSLRLAADADRQRCRELALSTLERAHAGSAESVRRLATDPRFRMFDGEPRFEALIR